MGIVALLTAACGLPLAPGPTPGGPPFPTGTPDASATPRPTAAPTPTPDPAVRHTVARGETLIAIARRYETTPESIGYWNRSTYPTLDPVSAAYDPDRIQAGWVLVLYPGQTVDPDDPPPTPTASGRPSAAPSSTPSAAPVTPRPDGACALVSHGDRAFGGVALTFDMGGELGPALDIVDWLVQNRVEATIFPTGRAGSETEIGRQVMTMIRARPDLFALGNHSWDHPDFSDLTAAQVRDQLVRTEDMLVPLAGRTTKPWFRPPYGAHDAAVRRDVGAAGWAYCVMWDVDTIDWRPTADAGPTADDIVSKVISRAQGGSIVLMHLGGWHTREALPRVVEGLRGRGLEPVTLPELLGVDR